MSRLASFLCVVMLLALSFPVLAKKPKAKAKPSHELLDKTFRSRHQKIIDKMMEGKPQQALAIARATLGQYPRSGRAHLLMGFAYKGQKKYTMAISYFKKSASFFDTQKDFFEKGQALYNVAFCHELAKERRKALVAWQIYLGHTNANLREVAGRTFAQGRIAVLQKVLKKKKK